MPNPTSIFRSGPPPDQAGESQHRRNDTHETLDIANLSFDGNDSGVVSLGDELGLGLPLSQSNHGHPDQTLSGGAGGVTGIARPAPIANRGRSTSNGSRRTSTDGSKPMKVASHEPIPVESTSDEDVRHTSFVVRLLHCRRTQVKVAVAALCVVGIAVGVTLFMCGNNGGSNDGGSSAVTGTGNGSGHSGPRPSGDTNGEIDNGGYIPEPEPTQDEAGHNVPSSSAQTEDWDLAMHLNAGDPTLSSLGSALSFSADGNRLAISASNSDTIQVMKVNADGLWSKLGDDLPGKVAAMSGDGTRIAVADATESSVATYELLRSEWTLYGTVLTDLWGANSVSLNEDGTTLAVSHHPDAICRICPSVASVYDLTGSEESWTPSSDILGAYDFDFSVSLSSDGKTLGFSGRVYEKSTKSEGSAAHDSDGWRVKADFPDFISGMTTISSSGRTAAVTLPDCHIFKSTDPTQSECTNEETYELSVMEYLPTIGDAGWWNRKGVSIGPEVASHLTSTDISLSEDGNTVAIAVGTRGEGGEVAVPTGDEIPLQNGPLRRRLTQEEDHQGSAIVHKSRQEQGVTDEDFMDLTAYETNEAYVRVYRYDGANGEWYTVGKDIQLDASGSTVALSADGERMAIGVPYGGEDDLGYVKIYDLVN